MAGLVNTSYQLARMMNRPLLYVGRHGWTGDDNSYNSPVNPPLDKKGLEDAHAAADFLADKITGPIYTSGFQRSLETSNIIGDKLGKKPNVDARLDSWDVGDIAKADSAEEADRLVKHHVENPDKSTPGGESLSHMRQRVEPSLWEGVQYGLKTGKPPIYEAHHSIQHEVGRVFNGDHESALTHTGGFVAVILTPKGLKAIPVFRPEKDPPLY